MRFNLTKIMGFVITVLLVIIFLQNSCNRENEIIDPIEVVVPEKKVKPTAPVVIEEVVDTFYVDGVKYTPKENKPDTELLNKYIKENDSLKKLKLHEEAITKRTYRNTFKDSNINLDLLTETTGTLDELSLISYKLNERTVPYNPTPKSDFAIYIGGELIIPTTPIGRFDAAVKAIVQNKGMQYSLGYSARQTVMVGLAIKL